MDLFLWVIPFVVAAGSAILSYFLMHSRMEVAVAQEREAHAGTQAKLRSMEESLPDKIRAAEESAQRKAFDAFLMDFRVEERRYLRESKSQFTPQRALVMQERLYFRNIPLSNWVEHEMPLDNNFNVQMLDQSSVFTARAIAEYGPTITQPNGKYLTQ